MEQLRTHSAKEISELEKNLGSQQELCAALDQTHPELVIELGDAAELCLFSRQWYSNHFQSLNQIFKNLSNCGPFRQTTFKGLWQTEPMRKGLKEKLSLSFSPPGCIKPGLQWHTDFYFRCFIYNHEGTRKFDGRSTFSTFHVSSTEQGVSSIFFISSQLCTVRALLQKSVPMLLRLNEKAAVALEERDECLSARDQAVADRQQVWGHPRHRDAFKTVMVAG